MLKSIINCFNFCFFVVICEKKLIKQVDAIYDEAFIVV